MALNPLAYTENVLQSFLRYQLTAYPFADERLHRQMRDLLSLETARETPLLRGPFVSLSRAFQAGAKVEQLVADGTLHPHMQQLIPFPAMYGHQEEAIRAIVHGSPTLISTGTGSGKSECFLYPIISRCLELRDSEAEAGICAVIVYPMNALAEDQLGRMRELLAGSHIPFGMYVGKTPQTEAEVRGRRLRAGSSRVDYQAALQRAQAEGEGTVVHPPEEVCSREMMRTQGKQPRILLTNVNQLELLLTRQSDVELFDNARLDFVIFDEAHTFTGAQGAETACLIRRLRSFCGRDPRETVCVATSATIVDREEQDAARAFASRFFGVLSEEVVAVQEQYEEDVWSAFRAVPAPPSDPIATLRKALQAVDASEPDPLIRELWQDLTETTLPGENWEVALHTSLAANELLYQAARLLERPRALADLLEGLHEAVGRAVTEEELILWLTLGAAARRDGRPLIRPIVHGFMRGVPGAVVSFDGESEEPILHLSADPEEADIPEGAATFAVNTCTTCGQHYFAHNLAGFDYSGRTPGGGLASGDSVYWEPADESHGGIRVLFVDRLISSEEEDGEEEHPRLTPLHICRYCGAAHSDAAERCLACGTEGLRVTLRAVQQQQDRPGKLHRCVCCGANGRLMGGRYREPIRPVRAVNVADVHILAQDMVHHAERRRLLVFADNRQDAAFQAGWMRDHARRFRLRALIGRELAARPLSVGDLTHQLDAVVEDDDALSMALLPEVWAVAQKEAQGQYHRSERQFLLRTLILREITMAAKQQIGLEPWGRLRVDYAGLDREAGFIREWAGRLSFPAEELTEGIAALLDLERRRRLLLDRSGHIFSKFWLPGAREIESGYLPLMNDVPKGIKLTRAPEDDKNRINQWMSATGHRTTAVEIALKWGVAAEDTEEFLRGLWAYLTGRSVGLLTQVTLKGARDGALPNCSGAHQVDADRLLLTATHGVYRCRTCRRRSARRPPGGKCLAWRCAGEVEFLEEDADNYDLQLLDGDYEMLRPREHTGMVPHQERERIEQVFKGDTDDINALVCTQTLELGVDIGALDAVLMRNVPPLPANYWQRAGRAGRRHRMACNLTYCRTVSHDRAYFADPLKMLEGRVDPPAFNLSNDLMVAKHVHATVLTRLHQLARPASDLSEADREEVQGALATAFPGRISEYLFEPGGEVRTHPRECGPLHTVVTKHQAEIESSVVGAFRQGWPGEDEAVVAAEKLAGHVLGMTSELEAVITRLHRRLRWALEQLDMLGRLRRRLGVLDEEQQAFRGRCERLVRRLKGTDRRQRRDAEGLDDTNTYAVLAREGFLPGYGLESGSVLGMAEVPRWVRGVGDFDLPRPPGIALREYVPGNLIYANSQEFVPRKYALEVGAGRQEALTLEVNVERQSVREVSGGVTGDMQAGVVSSIPICDVTLAHSSRITDEEENRFQMGVTIYGRELDQHEGGRAYLWGSRQLHLRKGVRFQLVNVGPTSTIASRREFGYPVCRVCGQSISPFSSQRQRDDFGTKHEEWCGRTPENTAFHTDLSVDAITLPACSSPEEAYSLVEAIRFAAGELLDMDLDDLTVLVLGNSDSTDLEAVLYDPMPGGSGLLEQICLRFPEIVDEAVRIAGDCPANCDTSCVDCLQRYRNAFYHKHLNRQLIAQRLQEWGGTLVEAHPIPAKLPDEEADPEAMPVNEAERKLKRMLRSADLPEGRWQQRRTLPRPLNSTTPDVTFDDPDEDERKIYVYLDGLSTHIHGNPETRDQDIQIRSELRAEGHEVIEITRVDLDDQQAMTRHFKRLARQLIGRDVLDRVSADAANWFAARDKETDQAGTSGGEGVIQMPFLVVEDPAAEERFRTCVPLYSLQAAAGSFSENQIPEPEGWARLETGRRLTQSMFVGQVVGKSMEPRIPDGAWCLFTREVGGSRHGRILLVQHQSISDLDTGGQYTVKRYERAPQAAGEGRELRGMIVLRPINPDYEPIRIEEGDEEVQVMAELVEVLE